MFLYFVSTIEAASLSAILVSANKFLVRHNSDEDRRVVKVALAEKGQESYKAFLTQKKAMTKKSFPTSMRKIRLGPRPFTRFVGIYRHI